MICRATPPPNDGTIGNAISPRSYTQIAQRRNGRKEIPEIRGEYDGKQVKIHSF